MHRGEVKVFIALGGNFALCTPDLAYTAQALRQCDLTVQVSTKPNRSHIVHGKKALILPCLARTDKDRQGERFAGGDRRGLDVDGAHFIRNEGARLPASAFRVRDRRGYGPSDAPI
jgi:anaerobic selenocysteine-containing dehydrogenase